MNIALIGYGKMGQLIEAAALRQGLRVTAIVDPFAPHERGASGAPLFKTIDQLPPGVDTAIEFTRPDTAAANLIALARMRVPAVTGTTGWLDKLDEVRQAVEAEGSALLWASNFSLGVNLFYRIAAHAAALADPFPEYDVGGWEIHHNKKADSPSGTAKTLVEAVLGRMSRKKKAVWEVLDRPPAPDELHYPSLRAGSLPGLHALIFDSPADTIEITHTARNRESFASGALRGAEWLFDGGHPRRGVFTMDDVLEGIMGRL